MRIKSVFLSVISAWTILFLMSCGQRITDDEAKKILLQYLKYPDPVFNITHAGPVASPDIPRFIKAAEKLASEGYLREETEHEGASQKNKTYGPTEKSKNFVTGVFVRDSFASYDGALCNEVLKKIESVEIDKGGNTAVIRYITGYEPIEPYYSLFCINEYCDYFGEKLKKEETKMIKVKKYGKGWRLAPS